MFNKVSIGLSNRSISATFKACIMAMLSVAMISGTAAGQQVLNGIEILVNDEPISSFDIDQRLRLVVAISGGVKTQEELTKVRKQVIDTMIDELLQLQEAKELELNVQDEELDQYFARRAQGLRQTPEQLANALVQIGSSKDTMITQMKAEMVWGRLVSGRLGAFVSVSDEEVEAFINRMKRNKGKFEYRLAEIELRIANESQAEAIKTTAEQVVARLRANARFPDLARQISTASTAPVGGDLGWVLESDLNDETIALIQNAEVGEILDPVRTLNGYRILAVIDRRRVLSADPMDEQILLRQLFITKAEMEDAEKVAAFTSAVQSLATSTNDICGTVGTVGTTAGLTAPTEIGNIRLRDLNPNLRKALKSVEDGRPTDIINSDDGDRILVVCNREEAAVEEPDFDAIYSQIENQRLGMMSRRYLRDLRRDAIIDYR